MLTYDNLLVEALTALPTFQREYAKMLECGELDPESGNHIVFSYAFTPLLVTAIRENDEITRDKLLAFLEEMASSEDHLVVEVCDYSVLEILNDEFSADVLIPLFAENTLTGYTAIKKYMA